MTGFQSKLLYGPFEIMNRKEMNLLVEPTKIFFSVSAGWNEWTPYLVVSDLSYGGLSLVASRRRTFFSNLSAAATSWLHLFGIVSLAASCWWPLVGGLFSASSLRYHLLSSFLAASPPRQPYPSGTLRAPNLELEESNWLNKSLFASLIMCSYCLTISVTSDWQPPAMVELWSKWSKIANLQAKLDIWVSNTRKYNLLIDGLLIYAIYESQTTRKRTRTASNNHLTEKYPTFWAKNWDMG